MKKGISQSAISIYKECPYAYYLEYNFNRQAMHFNPDVMDTGKLVHDAIDKYYKLYYLTTGTAEDILTESYDVLRRNWDTSLELEELNKGYTCLHHHSLFEYSNIKNGITKPLTEIDIYGNGYHGVIDYDDLVNNKAIDWKTGRSVYLSKGYRMQAHVYKELLESEFSQTLDHFYFFFLYPNEWRIVKFDDEKQKKIGEETENLKNDILISWDNDEFPKQPRLESGCRSCAYKYYCMIEQCQVS